MTLIRYIDGPWIGTTVETECNEVHGVHTTVDPDGCNVHHAITYRVDKADRTARMIYPVALKLVSEATSDDLVNELLTRAAYGDQVAARHLTDLTSPMRRGRRALARVRAGFGQVPREDW